MAQNSDLVVTDFDASDNHEVSVVLIDRPLEWRVRVVEELTLDAATSCSRTRSVQAAPLRSVVTSFVPVETKTLLVAMTLGTIPRGPLVDFSAEGPLGSAWLLPRTTIAGIQAQFLRMLAARAGISWSTEVQTVVEEVVGFSSSSEPTVNDRDLVSFVESGLGEFLSEQERVGLRSLNERGRNVLRPFLDVFKGYSAPESPGLTLPSLVANGRFESRPAAFDALARYVEFLEECEIRANAGDTSADTLLEVLADYANHYELIVVVRVPLDEPFTVKFSERRATRLSGWTGWGEQNVEIADARTNHLTFKVVDPNVRIRKFKLMSASNRSSFAYGNFAFRKSDDQHRSLYTHDPDRDFRAVLRFRVALLRRLETTPYVVAVLLWLLVAAIVDSKPADLGTLGVIVGPAALAATFVQAREQSTLGSRLRLASTLVLLGSLGALVMSAVWSYLSTGCS